MKKNNNYSIFFFLLALTFSSSAFAMGKAKERKKGCELKRVTIAENVMLPEVCTGAVRDQFDHDFKLKEKWFGGLGWESPCDPNQPLGRLLLGLATLKGAHSSDVNGMVNRGYDFAASNVKVLKVNCDADYVAKTNFSIGQNGVQLSENYFNAEVLDRASTLVHESRHADGNYHAFSENCKRGGSCDRNWSQNGANTYEALYLWDLAKSGTNVNVPVRYRSAILAQRIIDRAFLETPSLDVLSDVNLDPSQRWDFSDFSKIATLLRQFKNPSQSGGTAGGSDGLPTRDRLPAFQNR